MIISDHSGVFSFLGLYYPCEILYRGYYFPNLYSAISAALDPRNASLISSQARENNYYQLIKPSNDEDLRQFVRQLLSFLVQKYSNKRIQSELFTKVDIGDSISYPDFERFMGKDYIGYFTNRIRMYGSDIDKVLNNLNIDI